MRVVRLHTDEGFTTAILGEPGRIYTPYVVIELPAIRKRRMPNGDVARYATDIDYPMKKACRAFLSFGNKHTITKGAKGLVKEAWA